MRVFLVHVLVCSLVLTPVLALAAPPTSAHACPCAHPGPYAGELFERAFAVFNGTVETTIIDEHGRREQVAVLRVLSVDKGQIGETIEVRTPVGLGTCGYPLLLGVSYRLYANRRDDGTLGIDACGMNERHRPYPPFVDVVIKPEAPPSAQPENAPSVFVLLGGVVATLALILAVQAWVLRRLLRG